MLKLMSVASVVVMILPVLFIQQMFYLAVIQILQDSNLILTMLLSSVLPVVWQNLQDLLFQRETIQSLDLVLPVP